MALVSLIALLLLCIHAPSEAQVIFQREPFEIAPPPAKSQVVENIEDKTTLPAKTAAQKQKNDVRISHQFSGEIRGEEALTLEYIHTLNTLDEYSTVMILLDAPSIVSLPIYNVYTPIDVAFVDNDGEIIQIIPSIVPAEITRDIQAKTPIRALIFFKTGITKSLDIRPRDIVKFSAFNARPIIIQ